MALPTKLTEIIGDEEKAKALETALGEFFIPKTAYAELNAKLKTASDSLVASQKELDVAKTSTLTETEKTTKMQKDLETQIGGLAMQKNRMDAEHLFVAKGISEESYKEALDAMVTADPAATMKLANLFLGAVETASTKKAQDVKDALLKGAPPAGGGNTLPKSEEDKVRDLFKSQAPAIVMPIAEPQK